MPRHTETILSRVKAKLGDVSDYRAAQDLGVTPQAVSKWKLGKNIMDDGAAIKAATILGERPETILTLLAADRASTAEARKLWTNLARSLQRSTAAVIIAGLGFTAFSSDRAQGAEASSSQGMYIMLHSNYGGKTVHAARNRD